MRWARNEIQEVEKQDRSMERMIVFSLFFVRMHFLHNQTVPKNVRRQATKNTIFDIKQINLSYTMLSLPK